MGLQSDARSYISSKLGSSYINALAWRDMWVFIFQRDRNNIKALAESYQKSPDFDRWANAVLVRASVRRETDVQTGCNWETNEENRRRREFCEKFEGYPGVCGCK